MLLSDRWAALESSVAHLPPLAPGFLKPSLKVDYSLIFRGAV